MTEERPPYEIDGEIPPQGRPRRTSGLVLPILLIGVGAVVLLDNLGVINMSWQALLRFWPVLLIIIGLDVIFGRRSRFGGLVVALAALFALGGLIWVASSPQRTEALGIRAPIGGREVSGSIQEPLQDVKQLQVNIDLSISELVIGAQPGKQYAAQGDYSTDSVVEPSARYETHGKRGDLTITQPSGRLSFLPGLNNQNRISVNLPAGVPIDLTVSDDMGGLTLDLSKLDVRSLTVNNSMGQVTVILPQNAEMDTVSVSADLGSVTVSAPGGATINTRSLQIKSDSGAVTLSLPTVGSLGDVNVGSDLGSIQVKAPGDASLNMKSLDVEGGSGAVNVTLPREGDLGDVTVKTGMGEIVIDVPGSPAGLLVDSLEVNSGSGAVKVVLPNKGNYDASISADMGSITVSVPDDLEAQAKISTDMGSKEVSNPRFNKVDADTWETSGYSGAANRVQLDIQSGAGGVTVQ